MSQLFSLSSSSARQAVRYLFSYVSSDYNASLTFNADIDTDCNTARIEARAVAQLDDARTLVPGGGPVSLRGAGAEADEHVKKGRLAIGSAETRLKDMVKQLGANGPGVADAREAIASAIGAVDTADGTLRALNAAHGMAVPWYVQDGRLNCGVGARLEALEKLRPGSATALQQAADRARDELDAAPGCDGTTWEDRGVGAATRTATATIDQLLRDTANAEGGLGQDTELYLFDLREQALRRYAEQGAAGWPEMFDQTLERLQEKNPDLQANHLSELNDAMTGEMARARKAIVEAKTPDAVQRAVEEALKSLRVAMGNLAKQVSTTAGQGRVQTAAEQKLKEEQERDAYVAALIKTEDGLERLRIAEAPEYPGLRKRYEAIRSEADRSGNLVKASGTDLPALQKEAEQISDRLHDTVEQALDPLYELLERLRHEFEDKELDLRRSKDTGIQALLKSIKQDLADATDFLDCQDNVDAAQPAGPILAHAEQLLKDFDDVAEALTRQGKAIGTVEQRLARVDTSVVPADDILILQRKLAALRPQLGTMTEQELQGQLTTIGEGIDRLATFVTDLAKWREAARRDLAEVEKGFRAYAQAVATATFPGKRPDPAKGGVRAALDALAEQVGAPLAPLAFKGESDAWNARLLAARQALAKVWDGTALASQAEATKDGQIGEARAAAAREAVAKEKTLKQALAAAGSKIPATGAARAEYQTLQQQLQAAGPLVKSDPQTALLQMEDIEARLARLPGTPEFNQAVARTIGAVPKQWQEAVALTRQRLKELASAIATAATGSPFAQSASGVGAVLDRAADGFDATAYTQTVGILADANRTPDERRAARETALRMVRQHQGVLMADPLVRHVQANPFKVPVFGPLFRLLEAIELELNRFAC